MSKRTSPVDSGGGSSANSSSTMSAPSKPKRAKVEFDFDSKFIATSQDDLDIGLLRVQNRRLAERLIQRQRIEHDLRARIDNLEKKQLNDDTKLYVINRYWNQLNDDMRLILQRLDGPDAHESKSPGNEDSNESSGSTSLLNSASGKGGSETSNFMKQLANCDKEELDEALQQRVQLSTRAVSKVLQAFERLGRRNEQVMSAVKNCSIDLKEEEAAELLAAGEIEPGAIKSPKSPAESSVALKTKRITVVNEAVRLQNQELTKENKNLNNLITSLHEKHHVLNAQNLQMKDKLEAEELMVDELKNRVDELEFELNKSKTREQRLEDHFFEAREKLRDLMTNGAAAANADANAQGNGGKSQDQYAGASAAKMEELRREVEEQRELSGSRYAELEQLNSDYKELLKQSEKYKFELACLPESVIVETAEYKSLQAHFSVLFNDAVQLQNTYDETRAQLLNAKNAHLKQIEHMEAEELQMQKKLRSECMQLQDSQAQIKKEYEMLRLEFEQTLAANEQTGPINREMRHLITSLQNHTQQLKGECARLKKKLKESNVECFRLRAIIEEANLRVASGGLLLPDPKLEHPPPSAQAAAAAAASSHQQPTHHPPAQPKPESDAAVKPEPQVLSDGSNDGTLVMNLPSEGDEIKKEAATPTTTTPVKAEIKSEPPTSPAPPPHHSHHPHASLTPIKKGQIPASSPHSELDPDLGSILACSSGGDSVASTPSTAHISSSHHGSKDLEQQNRELKAQLKKAVESQRELKLLLDMFKSVDKEKRDKAQMMLNDKKLRMENEELRSQIKRHQEMERRGDKRRLTDEEYNRKVTKYEEVIAQLQKNVTAHKQEEEALLNEMEVTGQAFEDMQEQNIRLMQQLREKDDANFKLISERIKSNAIQKMLKEEKDNLNDQINAHQAQIDAQNQVVRKLEEKERLQQNNLSTLEKELSLRQQAMDFHKRKAVEAAQTANDLKMHLDKYVNQIKDAQDIVADKTTAWQQETFKTKRLNEELQMYKRKYERAKKFEIATTADEVLQEEIRELKEELTCPSCKTKRKDAVLNKCFHVFCYDCLKTRYETRQRKCPKCNQSFSANDFHRLYLA